MNILFDSVATAKEAILKRWRRKITPTRTEVEATTENSPELPHHILHDALEELENPMQCDDADQESPSKKRKLDLDFSDSSSSNGFLFREPPKHGADDICKDSAKSPTSKTARLDMSYEELLKCEKSLKKPMLKCDCHICCDSSSSSDGIVFIEPKAEKNEMSRERSLKKPMQRNDSGDDGQETAHKKRRLDHNFSDPAKSEDWEITVDSGSSVNPLPEEVRMKIMQRAEEAGGDESEKNVKVVLVIEKVLQKSDILRSQNRITIPRNQMENTFLSGEEIRHLRKMRSRSDANHLAVPIIEPSGEVVMLALRRWNVGKNSVSYVFNGDWKDVVKVNQLQQGQTAQVWAFRVKGQLNFAFVFLPN